ncbi:MAG: cytochrome c [Albidovulum sp.]
MNKQLLGAVMLAVVIGGGFVIYSPWQDAPTTNDTVAATNQPSTLPQGAALVEVTPATLTGNEIMGETAFNAKCATCHGKNGAGQNGVAPPLIHKFYEPGHHGDQAFFLAVQNGVRSHHWRFGDMPPVPGLTRSDVANIVAYIRAVQRANGIN